MAIALEEAKAALHGRSLTKAGSLPLDLREIGPIAVLRNRAGAILFQQGNADAAAALFQANVTLLSTLPPEKLSAGVPQADLPTATPSTSVLPVVETCGGLKFRAQAGLDYAAWARRYHEPADLALAAQTYKRLVVDFNVTDAKPAVLQAVVNLGLAELEVSKGNFAQARVLLRNEGATPQPLWQEMRKVKPQVNGGMR